MTANMLQTNVMVPYNEGALLPASFRGKAGRDTCGNPQSRRLVSMAESQTRSADDLRRSAQMAAAQAGDRAAYEALLRDCVPLIKAVAGRQGVPADRADDVVQDVLITVHRARQTYDPARSFTAWLRVIAERRAIDLMRQVRRHGAREFHAPLAFEAYADESADPTRGVVQTEATGQVNEALASLPPRQREAVEMLVLKEQTLTEAAAATRSSKGALKVNLHRALKALRGKIERTRSSEPGEMP
ncbi:MAG TPA: RNA polymerase sigma factor [Pseudolabrys sp.]|nr:RNA polymerase sigma factor [Pseudolabrys sp.]